MGDDDTWNRLEQLLAGVETAGPVKAEWVARAEAELGLTLPRSYRLFLERFGACVLNGVEVAGIDPMRIDESEPPRWTDIVRATKGLWRRHVPRHLLFVSDDGGDYKFCLDTSVRDATGECPVVVLGPGMEGEAIAADFTEFLARAAKNDDLFTGPPWK
jgi:hypothetical protein